MLNLYLNINLSFRHKFQKLAILSGKNQNLKKKQKNKIKKISTLIKKERKKSSSKI